MSKKGTIELEFNGPFAHMCDAFVKQRRAVGVNFNGSIWTLRRFDNLAKNFDIHDCKITRELAAAWMEKMPNECDATHNGRLYLMWQFADFLVQQGYDTYMQRFKLRHRSTHTPYIFTKDEIKHMFNHLDKMDESHCSPVKHLSFPVLYRILYGCGLRISEALNLTLADVDTDKCTLHIDCGKNKKERIVPMDATLAEHCKRYIDAVHAGHEPKHLLVFSRDGKSYGVSNIEKHFRALLWEIDIPYCGKDLGPRVHDLRHTFICHRLKEWAEDGTDLMNALPILSKYVGHENISGTEWYLKLTVEAFPAITGAMNELTGYVFPQVGG